MEKESNSVEDTGTFLGSYIGKRGEEGERRGGREKGEEAGEGETWSQHLGTKRPP